MGYIMVVVVGTEMVILGMWLYVGTWTILKSVANQRTKKVAQIVREAVDL